MSQKILHLPYWELLFLISAERGRKEAGAENAPPPVILNLSQNVPPTFLPLTQGAPFSYYRGVNAHKWIRIKLYVGPFCKLSTVMTVFQQLLYCIAISQSFVVRLVNCQLRHSFTQFRDCWSPMTDWGELTLPFPFLGQFIKYELIKEKNSNAWSFGRIACSQCKRTLGSYEAGQLSHTLYLYSDFSIHENSTQKFYAKQGKCTDWGGGI